MDGCLQWLGSNAFGLLNGLALGYYQPSPGVRFEVLKNEQNLPHSFFTKPKINEIDLL